MSEQVLERPARKRMAEPAQPPQLPQHRATVRWNVVIMVALLLGVAAFLTLGASEKARTTGRSPWTNPFTNAGWER